MRLERAPDGSAGWAAGPAVAIVLLLSGVLALVWIGLRMPTPICLFHEWTGFRCPLCGSTRLVDALIDGDLPAAIAWNPMVFMALAAVSIWVAVSTIRRFLGLPPFRVVLEACERRVARILLIVLVAAGWVWQVFTGA